MTNEHLRTSKNKAVPRYKSSSLSYLRLSKGKNDECYTHRYAVVPLLEFLPRFKDKIIWLPFDDENSEFVKVLSENGYKIINSHIKYGQDYYTYEPDEWDLIVSNPPFTQRSVTNCQGSSPCQFFTPTVVNKTEIFKRALDFNKPFCLLMSLTWLNDSTPKKLFRNKGLQLLMFEDRMTFKRTAAEGDRACDEQDLRLV